MAIRLYAMTLSGDKVYDVQEWDVDPSVFPPEWGMVDVTDLPVKPMIGWLYAEGIFSPPPEPEPPYVDPRPALNYELNRVNMESASQLRKMVLNDPDLGLGTPERAQLESLQIEAETIQAQLDGLEPQ